MDKLTFFELPLFFAALKRELLIGTPLPGNVYEVYWALNHIKHRELAVALFAEINGTELVTPEHCTQMIDEPWNLDLQKGIEEITKLFKP